MASRLTLQTKLEEILDSENVYFQPPPNFQMKYPCIVYRKINIRSAHADNEPYRFDNQYSITVIDANPDSEIPDKISRLPRCSFDRPFTSDNLNHYVFNILY